MKIETKDMALRVVHVPDALADRFTRRDAATDARWRVWTCSGCGSVEAGIHTDMSRVACAHCVVRIREGKSIVSPEELWHEALAEMAEDRLCRVCGEKVGPAAEELMRGQSVVCRSCVEGAAA